MEEMEMVIDSVSRRFPDLFKAYSSGELRAKLRSTRDIICERAFVERGQCSFRVAGSPHIPFSVGFDPSGPSQTCPPTIWLCDPQQPSPRTPEARRTRCGGEANG